MRFSANREQDAQKVSKSHREKLITIMRLHGLILDSKTIANGSLVLKDRSIHKMSDSRI